MNTKFDLVKLKKPFFIDGKNRKIYYYPPTDNFFYFTGNGHHKLLLGNWWHDDEEVILLMALAEFKRRNFKKDYLLRVPEILQMKEKFYPLMDAFTFLHHAKHLIKKEVFINKR